MFKIYKAEVENQQNRKIKVVRSDHGGEYYDRYDGSGRCSELFANFLKSGIVTQYTMQGHLIKMVLLRVKSHTKGHD